jgi:hypothetical protein
LVKQGQTNIYVFKVNERRYKEEMVKFIDFSNDGYNSVPTVKKKANKLAKKIQTKPKERY